MKWLVILTACGIALADGLATARPGPDSNYNVAISGGGGGGVTFPQAVHTSCAAACSTATATFGAGTSAGSIILVAVSFSSFLSPTIASVADGHGDTVTDSGKGQLNEGGGQASSAVNAFFAPTVGTTTITVTFSAATSWTNLWIWEVAGLSTKAFDQVVDKNAVDASPTITTGTLAIASEGAIGFISTGNVVTASSLTMSPGTFTFDGNGTGTTNNDQAGHDIPSSTTAITTTATTAFAGYVIWGVTVK